MKVEMKLKLLDRNCLPYKKHESDSGMDLKARLPQLLSLGQHEVKMIPVGIAIELPDGYEALIRPRSSLNKAGVLAALGTIDNQYRGELAVVLVNTTDMPYHINPYDRIAQLVVQPIVETSVYITDTLSDTERGAGGFGSTGK